MEVGAVTVEGIEAKGLESMLESLRCSIIQFAAALRSLGWAIRARKHTLQQQELHQVVGVDGDVVF